MKLTREEFIKKLRVPDTTIDGQLVNFGKVMNSSSKAFEKKENFILMSPRQSSRTTSVMLNILYELYYMDNRNDTYICVVNKADILTISRRFKEIIGLNQEIFKNSNFKVTYSFIYNTENPLSKVFFVAPSRIMNIRQYERTYHRLILIDAAYIEDKTPIVKLIAGWDTVIMETVPGPASTKFNPAFIKLVMDFNGAGMFKILKFYHTDLEYSLTWFEEQVHIYGDYMNQEHFDREILLKWS